MNEIPQISHTRKEETNNPGETLCRKKQRMSPLTVVSGTLDRAEGEHHRRARNVLS